MGPTARWRRLGGCLVLVAAMGMLDAARPASAQTTDAVADDGPPPPVAPDVITRDDSGRATVRAVRLTAPLRIDGALDEAIYRESKPFSGFIQIEPRAGEAATDDTDVWVTFDDRNVYVSARCWDSDIAGLRATELRRDNNAIFQGNDVFVFLFDTFHDRRNGIIFTVNPAAGRQDGQVSNERQYSGDFNPIWDVKTGRFDGGWTVEAAIPFKSLRYRPGQSQTWGFNAQRMKPSKNEISFLTRMPPARGRLAYQQISLAATMVGLEPPSNSRTLDLKPYVTTSLSTDMVARPRVSNDPGGQIGFDAKYAVTEGLTGDLTVRTDFAQVEADEQQVNLTRFNLLFPEKRDFFLENVGTFSFGGVSPTGAAAAGDAPILFYSRRIGLNHGRQVPLDAGGRLTGRIGRFTLGAANIATGRDEQSASPATNFSVVRVRRDLFRRSSVGLLLTGRSVALNGQGGNTAYGLDGSFAFLDNLLVSTYWARTSSRGRTGKDTSYRAQLDYPGDRYGVQVERLLIGDNFNPEVGFVRRDNMLRDFGQLRFSPRPDARGAISRTVRKFSYMGSVEHIRVPGGPLESRERLGEVAIEFQNGDRLAATLTNSYEMLAMPFRIATGVTLPVGGYHFNDLQLNFNMGQRRAQSFNLIASYGTFYNGHKTTVGASRGRMALNARLSVEPTYTLNRIALTQGTFSTHLAGARATYTMSPLMFTSALLQYNSGSHTLSANARLRWEYRPGSEFFLVYTDERDTLTAAFPGLRSRSLVMKINRLLRF